MSQQEVEAIYMRRRNQLQNELIENGLATEQDGADTDAYVESFIVHEKSQNIEFEDPMKAAYARIAEAPLGNC